jgi:hypothetical protein
VGSFSALQEPSVEFGAVVAGGAGREVVLGDALPGGDLLKRLSRLAPKVPGGCSAVIHSAACMSVNSFAVRDRLSAASVSARAIPESAT